MNRWVIRFRAAFRKLFRVGFSGKECWPVNELWWQSVLSSQRVLRPCLVGPWSLESGKPPVLWMTGESNSGPDSGLAKLRVRWWRWKMKSTPALHRSHGVS